MLRLELSLLMQLSLLLLQSLVELALGSQEICAVHGVNINLIDVHAELLRHLDTTLVRKLVRLLIKLRLEGCLSPEIILTPLLLLLLQLFAVVLQLIHVVQVEVLLDTNKLRVAHAVELVGLLEEAELGDLRLGHVESETTDGALRVILARRGLILGSFHVSEHTLRVNYPVDDLNKCSQVLDVDVLSYLTTKHLPHVKEKSAL